MEITKESIVGQIVASNYKTASVFKSNGIDFCCKGNLSIESVCQKKNLDSNNLLMELQKANQSNNNNTTDYTEWDLDLLADYIEKKHHRYVENVIPELSAYVSKIAQVHGNNHPELIEIKQLFLECAAELSQHMKKEELILFPYIRKLATNKVKEAPFFRSISSPIESMQNEHVAEGLRFEKISHLSNNYTPPIDACNTYRVSYAMLQEFEEDLHLHIHLENNILFPKSIALEKTILEN